MSQRVRRTNGGRTKTTARPCPRPGRSRSEAEARKLYDEALRQFQTVMSLQDDGSVPLRDLYREIGVVYFRLEQYDDAIATWQTGLRFAPNDPSLLNNLSIALPAKGDG